MNNKDKLYSYYNILTDKKYVIIFNNKQGSFHICNTQFGDIVYYPKKDRIFLKRNSTWGNNGMHFIEVNLLDTYFEFGKYKGTSMMCIVDHDPNYIIWAYEQQYFRVPKRILEEANKSLKLQNNE